MLSIFDAELRAEYAWKEARDADDGVDAAFSRIDHAAGTKPADLDALAESLDCAAARVRIAARRLREDLSKLESAAKGGAP